MCAKIVGPNYEKKLSPRIMRTPGFVCLGDAYKRVKVIQQLAVKIRNHYPPARATSEDEEHIGEVRVNHCLVGFGHK